MKKKVLSSLMIMGLSATLIGGATFAWFTNTAASSSNVFQAGTLHVGIKGDDTYFSNGPVTKTFSFAGNLQPGDIVTRTAEGARGSSVIEVKNTGNLNAVVMKRFHITSDDAQLANALVFTNFHVEWLNPSGNRVLDEAIINDANHPGTFTGLYNYAAYDTSGDGKLSLAEYQAAGNGFTLGGGWDFAALKPDSTWRMTFELKYDGALATDTQQGASLTGQYETFATQTNAEALQALAAARGTNGFDTNQVGAQLAFQ